MKSTSGISFALALPSVSVYLSLALSLSLKQGLILASDLRSSSDLSLLSAGRTGANTTYSSYSFDITSISLQNKMIIFIPHTSYFAYENKMQYSWKFWLTNPLTIQRLLLLLLLISARFLPLSSSLLSPPIPSIPVLLYFKAWSPVAQISLKLPI